MREQLIQYVNLLFAATPDSDEIRQEILQNTLDRYDDLVSQGKSPEAAYRLAISGIGDINEILTGVRPEPATAENAVGISEDPEKEKRIRVANGIAVALYVTCPVPLFIIGGTLGLGLMLAMIAVGVALQIIYDDDKDKKEARNASMSQVDTAQKKLHDSINSIIWAIGLAVYFIISFITGAWYVTWVLFPIIGCVCGLVNAIIDLKEANIK